MPRDTMKSELSPGRQRLVDLFQEIGFGRVERLLIKDGEPAPSPTPQVLRDLRLGRPRAFNHPPRHCDFALKREILDLLALLDREPSLWIESIQVEHGLPVRVLVSTSRLA